MRVLLYFLFLFLFLFLLLAPPAQAGFRDNLKNIRFADKRQLLGEGLSIFLAQDCLKIFRSSNDADFPGWLTYPVISEKELDGLSLLFTEVSIYVATWIFVGAFAQNCYAVTLPNRPRSSGVVLDSTNLQFLSFCNVFLVAALLNLFITHDHIDLAAAQTKIGLIYASVLGFRLIYANIWIYLATKIQATRTTAEAKTFLSGEEEKLGWYERKKLQRSFANKHSMCDSAE